MPGEQISSYEFGPFRLLPAERLLLRANENVPLAPKVFETLLALVRNRGRILAKEELMSLVWGKTIVEEGNLTQNIFVLRKVLGETRQDHKYLVTIPLQGYCFVAQVREAFSAELQNGRETSNAVVLRTANGSRSVRGHGGNIDAYQLYVKGRYFWESRTEQGLLKGVDYAQKAIAIDADSAASYAGLADSYLCLGEYLFASPAEAFPKAKAAALKAHQLDPDLAEAYASLAEVAFFYDWNWAEAERNYKLAIALNPGYATARHWYAWYLIMMGRLTEGLDKIREAQRIDPCSLTLHCVLGLPFYYERNYRRAIVQFRSTLDMAPDFAQARYYLGSSFAQLEMYVEAAAEFERLIPCEYSQQASALLGFVYARSGQKGRATEILKGLNELSANRYVSPYLEAIIYTGLGQVDRALSALERAWSERAAWMVFLKVDPFFDSIRGERRFQALLQKLQFPA